MMRPIRPSAANLALAYVLFGLIALICFAAPLWFAWQVTIRDGRAEILREDAERLSEVFQRQGVRGLTAFIDARVNLNIPHERMLLFADAEHRPLAGNVEQWPGGIQGGAGIYTTEVESNDTSVRAVCVHAELPGGYHLIVGRDLAYFAPLETRFWYGLSAAIAIVLIVGIIGALLVRRELLTRIHGIQQTVSAIMQGRLSHRLPTHGGADELDTLSQTINRMLDQIEQLVHGISNVSNSIAHDLRTPLAELRSRLEELSLTRPGPEETLAEIDAAVADVDRVIGIFNALLRLAEIDSGLRRAGFVPVDLYAVMLEIADFYMPAAEVKGIRLAIHCEAAATVSGDPILLAQAISNLVDNALKYAPADSSVNLFLDPEPEGAVSLTVADHGPGIPDEEKPRAAQRFFRGDASRGSPGAGLGLSIVEAVAWLHGGSLQLTDNRPGLRATMLIRSQQPHTDNVLVRPDAALLPVRRLPLAEGR
jgi:signal transduction histidine kinase